MFNSILGSEPTTISLLICFSASLLSGIVFTLICSINCKASKSFYIANAILPMATALVVALVNGNIGIGVAIAGAFSLVRFRSAQGTAKEISMIFISMASGLAFGTGYIAYAVLFLAVCALALVILEKVNLFGGKNEDKILVVTIPENLDYTTVFDDVFAKYLDKNEKYKVKSTNLGSMFKVYYKVQLKKDVSEKTFLDDLRVVNGNLEIMLEREELDYSL